MARMAEDSMQRYKERKEPGIYVDDEEEMQTSVEVTARPGWANRIETRQLGLRVAMLFPIGTGIWMAVKRLFDLNYWLAHVLPLFGPLIRW